MKNQLYVKIFVGFLALFLASGALFVYLCSANAKAYFEEANQKLHKTVAAHTVQEVSPFVDGEVDTNAIKDIMHSMMVINPSVEVYLLDKQGNIVTYVAPYKNVKVDKVPVEPIQRFLTTNDPERIKGMDPRHPEGEKVFSAAGIYENDQLEGYVYIILASEEQKSVLATLSGSYVLNSGVKILLISLMGALLLGFLLFWYFTKGLRNITSTVKSFEEGNLDARVAQEDHKEFEPFATSFNSMADRISSHINEIKKVESLRKELVANISHDLRTPLAIISGYVETLAIKKDISEDERNKYLDRILLSVSNLSKLIEQLFEYSKLEAKEIVPKKEPFNIRDLVQDLVHKFEGIARKKNIQLHTQLPSDIPLVVADIAMVERAISNLIDNAIKYSDNDDNVEIKLESMKNEVKITVLDTGPGIPDSQQSQIFERFKQYDPDNQKKGAGLGLAIVKKILEIHDKTIGILSEPGKGTQFFFNLPVYS